MQKHSLLFVFIILACAFLSACHKQGAGAQTSSVGTDPGAFNGKAATENQGTAANQASSKLRLPRSGRFVLRLKEQKLGHAQSDWSQDLSTGAIRMEQKVELKVLRFGQATSSTMTLISVESEGGKLLSFERLLDLGGAPIHDKGQVENGKLIMRSVKKKDSAALSGRVASSSADNRPVDELSWPDEALGPSGVERNLVNQPIRVGERRVLTVLEPVLLSLQEVTLHALGTEHLDFDGSTLSLIKLQVERKTTGKDAVDASTLWVDAQGDVWKSEDALGIIMIRTPVDSEDAPQEGPIDLGHYASISLDQSIPNPHRKEKIVFRMRCEDAAVWSQLSKSPRQSIKLVKEGEYDVTIRAEKTPENDCSHDPPEAAAKNPSRWVESDDPLIQQLAREAVGGAPRSASIGEVLEDFVHNKIKRRNFSQAFATAAEVARTSEGDCTEHAMLMTALARANGVPARTAMGLVYFEQPHPSLGYHMWNEFYLDGSWRSFDSTLGVGGIGPTHIKLSHSAATESVPFDNMHELANVIGKLTVSVVSFE